jgi:hypothetical protein
LPNEFIRKDRALGDGGGRAGRFQDGARHGIDVGMADGGQQIEGAPQVQLAFRLPPFHPPVAHGRLP